MAKLSLFILLWIFVCNVHASKCGAPVRIVNNTSISQTVNVCLEYRADSLGACEMPIEFKIEPNLTTNILVSYMCGYENDPGLESYWVLYSVGNASSYNSFKFGKSSVIIE